MKKITVILGMIFFSVFVLAQAAFPWGWAVHLYVDDQLRTKWNFRKMDLLYGGLSPDILAYRFDSLPYRNYLVNQTHNNFMKVWHEARSLRSKAFAFGFVSHNEVWGIDHTAHRSGITFGQKGTIPGAGPDEGGYVIAKAYILKDILMQVPEYAALQLPDAITLEIAHELVESGVDILMKKLDPALGSKMTAVAHHLHPESIPLLEKAYAEEFAKYFGIHYIDAFKFIKSSEQQFRQAAALYGEALTQDDATAIRLLAEHLAEFGNTFLSAYGLSLPPGVDLTPLLQFGISQSMVICADDFAPEVYETFIFVDQQLDAHGISFNYPGKSALFSTGSRDTMDLINTGSSEKIVSHTGTVILLSDREATIRCDENINGNGFLKGYIDILNETIELVGMVDPVNDTEKIYNVLFAGMHDKERNKHLEYVFSMYRE